MFRTGCFETYEGRVARHLPHQEPDSLTAFVGLPLVLAACGDVLSCHGIKQVVREHLVLQMPGFDQLLKPNADCEEFCLL